MFPVMHHAVPGLTLLLVLLLPAASAADPAGPCTSGLHAADPPHDPMLWPLMVPAHPHYEAPALDFLGYGIDLVDGEVTLRASFVAPPVRGDASETYRYWLGFHVAAAGGAPEYMDLRVAGTEQYEAGRLVSSGPQGLQSLAVVPLQWDGPDVQARFPLSILEELYGTPDLQVGSPVAGSDGPHRLGAQGPQGSTSSAPYLLDWAGYDAYGQEFVPVPVCLAGPDAEGSVQEAASNGAVATMAAFIAVLAAAVRRRA